MNRVEFYALKDYPEDKPSGNAADTFLRDLISGALTDSSVIQERCQHVSIPFKARFCLFCIKAPKDEVPTSRLISDVSLTVAPAKTIVVNSEIVILCFNCHSELCALKCQSGTCRKADVSVSSRLNKLMELYGMHCGRSSKFTRLNDVKIAYLQAKAAYEIGTRRESSRFKDVFRWSEITSFDNCVLDYFICRDDEAKASLALHTYAGAVLESIEAQDRANKTDNYGFLYEYLKNERRSSVVSEILHMHRNNVKYRIDRIEEQFGIDTDDPQLRFDLLLTYHIRAAVLMQNVQ